MGRSTPKPNVSLYLLREHEGLLFTGLQGGILWSSPVAEAHKIFLTPHHGCVLFLYCVVSVFQTSINSHRE